MSWLYIVLLAAAALMISAIGAVFSVFGLTSLFSGATFAVGLMAVSMEFAKVVTAGFIYRYWGHIGRTMRSYLSGAVVVLSLITSMGIFGYLSNAYQKSSLSLRAQEIQMAGLVEEATRSDEEINKIESFINGIPRNRISKKFALYRESKSQIDAFRQESLSSRKKIEELKLEMIQKQTEIGPIIYVAEMFHIKVETVARILIFVFVSVFDPLALCLVFAFSLAMRLKEKYRGDENRISRLSLAKPVDHRLKKAA